MATDSNSSSGSGFFDARLCESCREPLAPSQRRWCSAECRTDTWREAKGVAPDRRRAQLREAKNASRARNPAGSRAVDRRAEIRRQLRDGAFLPAYAVLNAEKPRFWLFRRRGNPVEIEPEVLTGFVYRLTRMTRVEPWCCLAVAALPGYRIESSVKMLERRPDCGHVRPWLTIHLVPRPDGDSNAGHTYTPETTCEACLSPPPVKFELVSDCDYRPRFHLRSTHAGEIEFEELTAGRPPKDQSESEVHRFASKKAWNPERD